MTRVLLTGAAGFQASYIIRRLRAKYDLTLFDRAAPREEFSDLPFISGDITRLEDVERAMEKCDAVVHLGALARGRRNRRRDAAAGGWGGREGKVWRRGASGGPRARARQPAARSLLRCDGERHLECGPRLRNAKSAAAGQHFQHRRERLAIVTKCAASRGREGGVRRRRSVLLPREKFGRGYRQRIPPGTRAGRDSL